MRLSELRLERYGHFTAVSLGLDSRPGVINVIEAPNGAGKSVVRQAILELLFGFRVNTPMNFVYDYRQLELRARAVLPDGAVCDFIRRKRDKNDLTDGAGRPAPAILQAMPREIERVRLERLFVLDSAQLRAGGKALLETDGDLVDALLSSAGDIGSSRSLARDLADQRDCLAPRRKKDAPFYAAAESWAAASARLAASLVKPAQVEEQTARRDAAIAGQAAAKASTAGAARALDRLNRVQRCRDHLLALTEALAWLDAHGHGVALPPGSVSRFEVATLAVTGRSHTLQGAQVQAAAVAERLEAIVVDEAALGHADAIDALAHRREQTRQSRRDLPGQQEVRAVAEAAIGQLLHDLGSRTAPADAAADLRPAADIEAARVLIAEFDTIVPAETKAAATLQTHRDALAEAQDDIAAPLPAASESLRAAVDAALDDGDSAKLLRDARAAADRAASERDAALARVPGWSGPANALATLPVPSGATLARLNKALVAAQAAATSAAGRLTQQEASAAAAAERLDAVTRAGPLPDAAALAQARGHRDRGWALVAARLLGTPDPDEASFAAPLPLVGAFQAAMAAADGVADRRAAEMERIAAADSHRAECARAQDAVRLAMGEVDQATRQLGAAMDEWAEAVRPMGLPAGADLAEAQAMIDGRDAALKAVGDHAAAEQAAATLLSRQAGLAGELATALGLPSEPLARLLAIAKGRITAANVAAERRQALARQLLASKRKVAEAEPAMHAARDARAAWSRRWDSALSRLGRPAGEAPHVTSTILDRLVDLRQATNEAAAARQRADSMAKQLATFEAEATRLSAQLGEPAGEALAVAERLAVRLAAARSIAGARDALAEQAVAAVEAVRQAQAGSDAAEAELGHALRAIGAATREDAEGLVVLSARQADQVQCVVDCTARLREAGDGLDPAELRAEATAHPAADIAQAKREAETDAADAQARLETATKAATVAEGELTRLAGSEEARLAASEREHAAAQLSAVLEEALVQQVAATMLDEALHAVEAARGDNELLASIGGAFARLTGGAYDRLSPASGDRENKDYKAGVEYGRLIAHEVGGGDTHVARLSEGTRDQLYLALRLIAIEQHIQRAPALPFVADDVLQTFDDRRARAALEELARLSQHVQVIILTHHPHLLVLAEGLMIHRVGLVSNRTVAA